tara:strand:- start:321 stop:1178 length:858 start_codon:yes stop_codon:yes gene_type:complete
MPRIPESVANIKNLFFKEKDASVDSLNLLLKAEGFQVGEETLKAQFNIKILDDVATIINDYYLEQGKISQEQGLTGQDLLNSIYQSIKNCDPNTEFSQEELESAVSMINHLNDYAAIPSRKPNELADIDTLIQNRLVHKKFDRSLGYDKNLILPLAFTLATTSFVACVLGLTGLAETEAQATAFVGLTIFSLPAGMGLGILVGGTIAGAHNKLAHGADKKKAKKEVMEEVIPAYEKRLAEFETLHNEWNETFKENLPQITDVISEKEAEFLASNTKARIKLKASF